MSQYHSMKVHLRWEQPPNLLEGCHRQIKKEEKTIKSVPRWNGWKKCKGKQRKCSTTSVHEGRVNVVNGSFIFMKVFIRVYEEFNIQKMFVSVLSIKCHDSQVSRLRTTKHHILGQCCGVGKMLTT